jgi:ribulose kinase
MVSKKDKWVIMALIACFVLPVLVGIVWDFSCLLTLICAAVGGILLGPSEPRKRYVYSWMSRHNHQKYSKEYQEWREARLKMTGGHFSSENELGDEYRAWLEAQGKE